MSVSVLKPYAASEALNAHVTPARPRKTVHDFHSVTRALLPSPIVHCGGAIEDWQEPLPPEERVFVENSVRRRVKEFTAGRNCARAALEQLGHKNVIIPMGARRQPLWPTGIVGSISHGAGYCVAAACARNQFASIGIDIEAATPLSNSLTSLVCSPAELRWCEAQGEALTGLLAKFHFSAKESVFKCLYPVLGEELEFHDVQLDLCLHQERFTAQVRPTNSDGAADLVVRGRFACTSQLVLTSAVLQDEDYRCLSTGHRFNAVHRNAVETCSACI